MEEIKVVEYIRTKDGIIRKYHHSDIHYGDVLIRTDKKDIIYDFEIVKHSPNIIDLIEEGDFVNGYICKRIPNFDNKMCNFDLNLMQWIPLEDIDVWYNIVTKEQFDSRKYIVGDESNE